MIDGLQKAKNLSDNGQYMPRCRNFTEYQQVIYKIWKSTDYYSCQTAGIN